MGLQEIEDLINRYGAIGKGLDNAEALLILSAPIGKDTILDPKSEEANILSAIWNKLGIDRDNWFITFPTDNNQRLCDITKLISPKIVVCCGAQALKAFVGPSVAESIKDKGKLVVDCPYVIWYTYDISMYVANKAAYPKEAVTIAANMMRHWQDIKKDLDSVLGFV